MRIAEHHPWNISTADARALQAELASQVVLEDTLARSEISIVAGVDNSYLKARKHTTACAAVVALTFPELEVIETAVVWQPVEFPYVPGLLSFREGPAILAACKQLSVEPDLFLFDGQGYAHPRRMGLASHLGVLLDRPAIGCAKSRLIGHYGEPGPEFGDFTPLLEGEEIIGAVVRTRPRHKPLFVSPGHKVSVEGAVGLALACCRDGGFMPVPTRRAHDVVTRERRARVEAAAS